MYTKILSVSPWDTVYLLWCTVIVRYNINNSELTKGIKVLIYVLSNQHYIWLWLQGMKVLIRVLSTLTQQEITQSGPFTVMTYLLVFVFPWASIVRACAKHQDVWLAPLPPSPWPAWHPVPLQHSTAPSNHGERHKRTAAQAPELMLTQHYYFTVHNITNFKRISEFTY